MSYRIGYVQSCSGQGRVRVPSVPELKWAEHRGILDIDGNVNAWGLFWRLASRSVVFKVDSPHTNAYIERMQPWVHYLPIHANLSNLRAMASLVTKPAYDEILLNITKNAVLLTQQFTLSKEITRVSHELVIILTYFRSKVKVSTNTTHTPT